MNKRNAVIPIVLAGCMWGTIGMFVRSLEKYAFSSMELVEVRCIITCLVAFIALGIFKPGLLKVKLKDLWCFAGTGIASMIFFNYCYFETIRLTSLSVAAILLYTSPIFVMILSRVIFKEKITPKKIVSLVMVVAGCVLVSGVLGGKSILTPKGFLIGIGAGFGYSLYSIFSRFALQKKYSPLTITAYTFLFASLGGTFFTDFGDLGSRIVQNGMKMAAYLLLFTIVSTILPYVFYTLGLKFVENGRASVIVSIEPVVAAIIGIAGFHEIPRPMVVIGMILVLGAVVILNINVETGKKSSLEVSN